jgi:hypothetical protein
VFAHVSRTPPKGQLQLLLSGVVSFPLTIQFFTRLAAMLSVAVTTLIEIVILSKWLKGTLKHACFRIDQ